MIEMDNIFKKLSSRNQEHENLFKSIESLYLVLDPEQTHKKISCGSKKSLELYPL